jgi:hypothetical protein
MDSGPLARPPKPPFDRERFVFKILAVVIGTLEQLQGGFDSTLKLLLALLGGAALTRMDR